MMSIVAPLMTRMIQAVEAELQQYRSLCPSDDEFFARMVINENRDTGVTTLVFDGKPVSEVRWWATPERIGWSLTRL